MKKIFSVIILTFLISSPVLAGGEKHMAEGGKTIIIKSTSSHEGIQLPAYNKGQPEIVILKNVVPPGKVIPSHTHTVIAVGLILSGELTVIDDDNNRVVLKEGDALIEAVGKYYSAVNEGTEPAVILAFFASIEGEPLIVNRE